MHYRKKLALSIAAVSCLGSMNSIAQIEEVVVTAQKREQSVQDVPIAVSSLSSEEIKDLGFESASDIQFQTPGLVVSYSSTSAIPNFSLRGVGLNDFTAIQSSPVAIHVDNVYYGNSTLLNFALFDIDRVEVLKGPQGTLYGRNSTGGAVNFFSAKPTDSFEAGLDIGYANNNKISTEAFVSGALTDDLLGRLSATRTRQTGGDYTHPVYGELGEKDQYAVRAQLLWAASDTTDIHWTLFGGEDQSDANQYQGFGAYALDGSGNLCSSIAQGQLSTSAACSFDPAGTVTVDDNDPYTSQAGLVNRDDVSAWGTSLQIDTEWNGLAITSITGFNQSDRVSQEDADGSPLRNVDVSYETEFTQMTQEIRFANTDAERWQWTLGLFYSDDELDSPRTETDLSDLFGGFRQNHAYRLDTESSAVFFNNEFELRDDTRLIAGIRYTDEDRHFRGGTITVESGLGPDSQGNTRPSPGPLPTDYNNPALFDSAYLNKEIGFNKWSWRLGINHDLTDYSMLYANISNGFKSGGFVGDITVGEILAEPYDAETLTAYEIGIKADLFDGVLRWNSSLFYYDYRDIILALTITDNPALDLLLTNENGSDADIKGFESDLWWAPNEHWDVKFGFTYLDSEQEALETRPFQVAEQLDGSALPYAPKLSANGIVRYQQDVGSNWTMSAQVDFTSRSNHYGEAMNSDLSRIAGYSIFNARLGFGPQDGSWNASLWVKNLNDKRYFQYVNDLTGLGSFIRTPGAPRAYGLNVSFSF